MRTGVYCVHRVTQLTDDHEDEEEGSHSGCDVEHDADVMRQLLHVVHVGHQDGRHKEPDGNTQLRNNQHR